MFKETGLRMKLLLSNRVGNNKNKLRILLPRKYSQSLRMVKELAESAGGDKYYGQQHGSQEGKIVRIQEKQ